MRVFVVGTDTGIGKTQAAGALLSLLADEGLSPAPFKPYESGCDDLSRPSDALFLRASARSVDPLDAISIHRFQAPLAPGVAAARLRMKPSFSKVRQAFRKLDKRPLVAEAAGGLLVPLDAKREVIDLVEALGMPALLVARAGLGTLNHTALSLEALGRRGIPVVAVLLVETRRSARLSETDPSVVDNAAWIRRRGKVRVLGPVPYCAEAQARREAFRAALRPLLGSGP